METRKFAVFILTHGRPNKVTTYRTLHKQGYTGPIYLLVDDEDATLPEYQEKFGEKVITFSKEEIASRYDEGDNFQDRRAVFYARNASFEIAKKLGLDYFLQLDDDYAIFCYKFGADLRYAMGEKPVKSLDKLFEIVLDYYATIPALTIALGQTGDFIGGKEANLARTLQIKRKAMNTFFCSTKRPFAFQGRINEDVNTYVELGRRGELLFTTFFVNINQEDTQQSAGGMTELYLNYGTYVKSFYTVMYAPSCVKVGEMGHLYRRLHHRVKWDDAVPKIVGEEHRKASKGEKKEENSLE